MGKRTSIEKREDVIRLFKEGKSQREISKIVAVSSSTVQHIIERFRKENRIEDKGRSAPNKIFSDADKRWIIRKIKANPHLSAPKLTAEVENYLGKTCNPETVRRVLREADLHGRTARNKPFVNAVNRKRRIEFSRLHLSKDISFWQSVIFADESKFNLFRSDGKSFVWRKPNTALSPSNLRATVKHGGGSVMVWGCMSYSGVGKLAFIEGNMDKRMYLDLLKDNLLQSAENLGIRDSFRFYQDNDPKHTSGIVKTWLIWNCPHVIQTPAQSPDLNVIENLWSLLENKIRNHNISSASDLKAALQEEWHKISADYTKKLVESMNSRLKAVLDQKGYPTKY